MNRVLPAVLSVAAVLALLSCQPAAPPTNTAENKPTTSPEAAKKTAPTDQKALSNRLVTQVAGVKEGDIVFITGGVRDLELLEDLVTDTRKVGAFPLLTVNSDRIGKKYFEEVPEKYDNQSPDLDLKLATLPTVSIGIDSNEAEDPLAGVSEGRRAAVGKSFEPVAELYLKRNVKQVGVGNGLYPTAWRAKQFGMSQDELAKTFWDAVNSDYSSVQATGEKVKGTLSAGKELHITDANGTDLKVRIEGRPFFVSDGIISPEDVQKGGPAVSVYLPAGEVYCAPVAGSAEGKVVLPQDFFRGKEITNLTVSFVGGKVSSMTGSGPGFQDMKAEYDAAGPGKELFSFVDFGINPGLHLWPTSKLGNWIQAGMVTVGTGNNTWAGGDVKVPYGINNHLPGCTVTLDGKTIIDKGVWKS